MANQLCFSLGLTSTYPVVDLSHVSTKNTQMCERLIKLYNISTNFSNNTSLILLKPRE